MDCLLKCYLEQFAALPRHSLHDRRNRRTVVDYISTLIQGCSQSSDLQTTIREAIMGLIRHHETHRSANGSVCMMGKFHNVLYVAVKLCFDWQLQDTGTVITLLEHIYSCERTFERIFIGAIFGNKAPHYIAGWKSDFDNQEQNLKAMVYYIDHATNGGFELSFNGVSMRFVDVPIESCGRASLLRLSLQLGLPDKVHILLRYGALIEDANKEEDSIEMLLDRLMEFYHCYPFNIVACLQFVLRTIPTIAIKKTELLEKYGDLVDAAIIPSSRCGLEAPELKHLCRCTIRRRLWENYQLPNGIQELPVPDSLKDYIDILND